jgi:FkbM family methyltransferase
MTRLMSLVRQFLLAVRLLGVTQALKVHGMRAFSGNACVTRVRLPGVPSDFWLRTSGSDLDVALQIFLKRDYDLSWCEPYKLHVERLCDMIIADGNVPLIVDAGANIGASALWFARNFQNCQIFAIEPESRNFELLRRNVAHCTNVTPVKAALWNMPTDLSLTDEGSTGWSVRVQPLGNGGTVSGVTVSELLASDERLRPVIVKIDIEGAEIALLQNNTEWVDDIPLVIFEQHDNLWHWLGMWQGSGHAFFSVLSRRKREYLFHGENIFAFLHPVTSR